MHKLLSIIIFSLSIAATAGEKKDNYIRISDHSSSYTKFPTISLDADVKYILEFLEEIRKKPKAVSYFAQQLEAYNKQVIKDSEIEKRYKKNVEIFFYACQMNLSKIVAAVLRSNDDVHRNYLLIKNKETTALKIACQNNSVGAARIILAYMDHDQLKNELLEAGQDSIHSYINYYREIMGDAGLSKLMYGYFLVCNQSKYTFHEANNVKITKIMTLNNFQTDDFTNFSLYLNPEGFAYLYNKEEEKNMLLITEDVLGVLVDNKTGTKTTVSAFNVIAIRESLKPQGIISKIKNFFSPKVIRVE